MTINVLELREDLQKIPNRDYLIKKCEKFWDVTIFYYLDKIRDKYFNKIYENKNNLNIYLWLYERCHYRDLRILKEIEEIV